MAVKNHANSPVDRQSYKSFSVVDVVQFMFLSMLLIIPIYAIVDSAINRNWIMVIIDALLVPVGFVHGVLLLFGVVD
jgi:hypothetical protein